MSCAFRHAARGVLLAVALALVVSSGAACEIRAGGQGVSELRLVPVGGATPRRIVFILADDHRYDAMGFMGHPFIRTPNMDRLARGGAHTRNAFVTTALCSPSRATMLTGLYAHQHRVVDNNNPGAPGTVFFPQYLQRAGYDTAFIGKWHMGGEGDDPQPGFDRWVSFRGQGTYSPSPSGLNVDGRRVPQKGYISDELTDYAIDWLRARPAEKPFFLYLSHKGVHAEFEPAAEPDLPALETDPGEMRNLIDDPAHVARARAMSARMYAVLAETQGLSIPLWPDRGGQQHLRSPGAAGAADFPPALIARPRPSP